MRGLSQAKEKCPRKKRISAGDDGDDDIDEWAGGDGDEVWPGAMRWWA